MYLDASAIVAILNKEDDAAYFLSKIDQAKKPMFYSSATAFEAIISLSRRIADTVVGAKAPTPPEIIERAQDIVEQFLSAIGAKEMAINGRMYRTALEAARTYGKFIAHPAKLNFGDCLAYACAKEYRLSLLCKGEDFPLTDIELA